MKLQPCHRAECKQLHDALQARCDAEKLDAAMTYKLPEPDTHCFDTDTGQDVWSYSREQMRAVRAATIEECARVCDEQADDANSNKRKPLLTANGQTLYEGMTVSAWNCAAAVRRLGSEL